MFTLVQSGTQLIPINSDGVQGSALTLPDGVTLRSNLVPRFARINRFLILVNTPTRPLSIDENGLVRLLTIPGPITALTLAGSAGGSLSGTYLAAQTYFLKDASGNIVSESAFGPLMSVPVTITTEFLRATGINLSPTAISGIRLYRTTTGPGGVYFKWVDIDGNTQTAYQDDLSDAGLGIVSAPILGPAPDLTLITEWQGRLWGVDRLDVDHLRYTEAGTMYAWSALNSIPIPHVGDDVGGIIGIVPRRNALGVAKHSAFSQITGTSNSNFQVVTVPGGEQASFVSQESCVVRNDIAIFLGVDGVYKWDSSGITSISDGKVRSWFATDQYFNRAQFYRAFAQLDRAGLKYRLFLCAAGQDFPNRWVEYDFLTNAWYGPHLTDAFNLSCAVDVVGNNGYVTAMMGSWQGFLSKNQEARNDWTSIPISSLLRTKSHNLDEPDVEKYWGELSVNGKVQPSGDMSIVPLVGAVEAPVTLTDATPIPTAAVVYTSSTPLTYHMPNGRQRLPRLGVGRQLTLQFTHSTLNEEVMLYGYEVNPVNIVGRR